MPFEDREPSHSWAASALVSRAWGLALVAGWLLVAGSARAYEDQAGVTLGVGYASSPTGERPKHGIIFDAGVSLGLDDVFTVRTRLSYALHPAPEAQYHQLLAIGTDLLYLIDILEWVPYFGLGLTAQAWLEPDDQDLDAAAQLIGGLDYLWDRELVLGLEARGMTMLRALEGDRLYVTIMFTATRLWDFW